jgi:hypothetical protein
MPKHQFLIEHAAIMRDILQNPNVQVIKDRFGQVREPYIKLALSVSDFTGSKGAIQAVYADIADIKDPDWINKIYGNLQPFIQSLTLPDVGNNVLDSKHFMEYKVYEQITAISQKLQAAEALAMAMEQAKSKEIAEALAAEAAKPKLATQASLF